MSIIKNNRKKLILACAVLTLLIFSMQVFGQSANTSLSGTVQDATKGYLPGVTITAKNVETGVETTTLTNESGAFAFPSLQPGSYTLRAELDGFQTNTKTDVSLSGGGQQRVNFELAVAGLNEEIEVVTTAQDILTESSSSTGTVLRAQQLIDLPLTSNDVMELVNIMGGVQPSRFENSGSEFDSNRTDQSFAGVNANAIHIQQDGVTINDVRYNTGISSSSRINTEMVSEFKLILSPVDAEMGRGMGQVQIMTKSGANAFHGSGVWNINNSALDANTWSNNMQTPVRQLEWRNLNTYTLSFSGPIKKNKTFFFVTWDHAIPRTHSNRAPQVLTNCARKGVFRYFDGWNSTRYDATTNWSGFARNTAGQITGLTAGAIQARPVVDLNGFPLDQQLADSLDYEFVGLVDNFVEPITGTPAQYISGGTYEGGSGLRYINVFGPLTEEAQADIEEDLVNCSAYTPYKTDETGQLIYDMANPTSEESLDALGVTRYWEQRPDLSGTLFRVLDTTAIRNFSAYMPPVNNWQLPPSSQGQAVVDGLNYGVNAWTRSDKGVDRIYGVGQENARKNITIKIDHNFSDRHRASGTYTYERDVNAGAQKLWSNGFEGTTERYPQRISVSLTSSLKPTLLNEGRFGLNRNLSHSLNAVDATATKDEIRSLMQTMLPTETWENYPKGEPFVFNPQRFWTNNYMSHFIGGAEQTWVWHSYLPSWGGYDHRWTMTDTLTWTKGRHSLKFGGEVRLTRSHQDADGDAGLLLSRPSMPVAFGGIAEFSLPKDLTPTTQLTQITGLTGTETFFPYAGTYLNWTTGTLRQLQDVRDYMAGSMSHIWQWFFINDPFDKTWNDINAGETERVVDIRQKEMSFFAKDDWKINNSLTLNLGLRYEYYGVPWMDRGMSLALQGGSDALFGVTGRSFANWMSDHPVNLGEEYYTVQEFVGPGSPQPDVSVFEKDLNNFGPAVGFAWQLPWFGKGKTTLRGGYQLSYSQIANADNINGGFADLLAGSTGTNFDFYYYGGQDQPYMRFADIDSYLPTKKYLETPGKEVLPLQTLDIKNREADLSVYDQNIVNPYTQSLNLSISRNISSNVTLDVRYIGTLARKQVSNLNLNAANWLYNGLKESFDIARAGGTTELLDHLFEGVQFNNSTALGTKNKIPVGAPGGPNGGEILRMQYATQLGNGDYNAIAGDLNMLDYTRVSAGAIVCPWAGAPPSWCSVDPGLNDSFPVLGTLEDGSILRHANTLYPGDFPENFIVANPQLGAANWYTNLNHNNYHSMQVQLTVRPTYDFNMTATYTWSKNLGNESYTNPADRTNPFDYTWTGNSRAHQLNTYGAWTLPFGANGFLFRDVSNPIVRRLIEGWNLSWILSMNSGSRGNISANQTHLYGNSVPNLVRPDLLDYENGHVYWAPGSGTGYYFGPPNQYMLGPDLQCYDPNLVYYSYNNVQVNTNEWIQVENTNQSVRDNCVTNLGSLYSYQTETVTEWYKPTAAEISAGTYVPNSYGYVQRDVVKNVYSTENVIMQNPLPGEYGNFGRNKIEGPGSFSLDMAMGKTVELTEGKSIGFRVDASNILNHPSPGGGNTTVGTTGDFGSIASKSGSRRFQAKITLRF